MPAGIAIVFEVFCRYADGESTMAIADWLNAQGVKGARGGRWYGATAAAILQNPAYIGHAVFRRKQRPCVGADASEYPPWRGRETNLG
jgi:hypothetical protein